MQHLCLSEAYFVQQTQSYYTDNLDKPKRGHEETPLSEKVKALYSKRNAKTKSYGEAAKTTITTLCGIVKKEKVGASLVVLLQTVF